MDRFLVVLGPGYLHISTEEEEHRNENNLDKKKKKSILSEIIFSMKYREHVLNVSELKTSIENSKKE